jgi:hypothetical protein
MFWRTGGKYPDAQLLKAVVPEVLFHQWMNPPQPIPAVRVQRLVQRQAVESM